jgi:outer membrane immunogenic protein
MVKGAITMRNTFLGAAGAALIASGAFAADMAYKAPAYAAPIPYSWTGVYVGIQVGGAVGAQPFDVGDVGITNPIINAAGVNSLGQAGAIGSNSVGFMGGPHIELLYQAPSTPWVFGLGADWNYSTLSSQGSGSNNNTILVGAIPVATSNIGTQANASVLWDASVYGKLGYAFDNNKLLAYAIGGLALGDLSDNASATTSATAVTLPTTLAGSTSNTHTGWTAGAGLAWAFEPSWVLKFEYRYVNLGTEGVTLVGTGSSVVGNTTQTFNINDKAAYNKFQAGLDYKF